MKTLPNGVTVFNSTPHSITFWMEEWDEPMDVECDTLINASVEERQVDSELLSNLSAKGVMLVETTFAGNDEGRAIIKEAYKSGADIVIGSIIAAQAYPGKVVAMTPAPGYERAAPSEKRMNPNKFTTF